MIYNFVVQVGDVFHFPTDLIKRNGLVIRVPLETLYTPYGMILPLASRAFTVLDVLETGEAQSCYHSNFPALTISHSGVVHDWYRLGGNRFSYARRPVGPGVVNIRSNEIETEERLVAAMDVCDNDFAKAWKLIQSCTRTADVEIATVKLADVIEHLKANYPEKPRARLKTRELED